MSDWGVRATTNGVGDSLKKSFGFQSLQVDKGVLSQGTDYGKVRLSVNKANYENIGYIMTCGLPMFDGFNLLASHIFSTGLYKRQDDFRYGRATGLGKFMSRGDIVYIQNKHNTIKRINMKDGHATIQPHCDNEGTRL